MSNAPVIFDRKLYLARQAGASGEAVDLLDFRVAEDLGERLAVINKHFARALLLAPRPEAFAKVLRASGKIDDIIAHPLTDSDDLRLPSGSSFDAAFSLLDLHAVNDVPGYLAQIAAVLKPDGLAMFAFFAGETLTELRQSWLAAETNVMGGATPRIAPMIDLREAGGLLQRAGLALPVSDLDRMTLRYSDPIALMREVKALGFSNPLVSRSRNGISRRLLLNAVSAYQLDHSDADGRVRATLEIAWAMAWKPHPSQQQPLKPGSASARLADALQSPGGSQS
ncbi:MAG: methyltransferase domain-containing protein [Proteobacteria bacterium]|nr:methyltransferase domain-containing protein [Pseudomonadota bacterium]